MRTPWLVTIVVAAHCLAAASMVLLPGCGTASPDMPRDEPDVVMPPTEPPPPVQPERTPELTPPAVTEWPAQTTTYVVKKGDTLSGIAKRFNMTLTELCAVNGIDNPDRIAAGQKLTLPGQVDMDAPQPEEPEPAPAGNVYEVKKGDTLSEIALRFGTTVKKLKGLNALANDKILVGQKLVIPSGAAVPAQPSDKPSDKPAQPAEEPLDLDAAPVEKPVAKPAPAEAEKQPSKPDETAMPAGKFRIHVVEADEDLYSIAMMWNASAAKIREINNLDDNEVKAGQRLKIPLGD